MARKSPLTKMAPEDQVGRIKKAVREERFQHALDLVKQLCRHEPTPENKKLQRDVYLGRIRQLRAQGQFLDARTMLGYIVVQADEAEPAWLEQIAREFAACGDSPRALQLAERFADPQVKARIVNQAVDAALAQPKTGRALLPEYLQPQFDLILQAFAQLEAGQDDAVRQALQGIGLQSPFLEWKLLLRGLQAYYGQDQARALENWGRLNSERIPARLAAPLRFRIDPAFLTAQKPASQAILQRQADRLHGSTLVQSLRVLQQTFSAEDMTRAFRLAEDIVRVMRQEAPGLLGRLGRCFQWAILEFGDRSDLQRYRRLFGAPPDDPQLDRLEALALERHGDMEEAHQYWQRYEQEVAKRADAWPAGQAAKVRALIWQRMGANAADIPDQDQLKQIPAFLRGMPGRPTPLDPPAEKCYERSLKLDPDQLPVYLDLIELFEEKQKPAKVEDVARRLLARFPEHVPTLQRLAELCQEREQFAEAVALYRRALKANPLDRMVRANLGRAHGLQARAFAEKGRFDEARREYEAALGLDEGPTRAVIYCRWAACELKAKQTERADQLLQQARAIQAQPLPLAYQMLVEAIRLKLPKDIKQRYDAEFNAALAEPPTAGASHAALLSATALRMGKVKYHGQGAHEKKLLAYLERVPPADFNEQQLLQVVGALVGLNQPKAVAEFADLGRQRFPANPRFPMLEAESHCVPKLKTSRFRKIMSLLTEAREVAHDLPPDQQKEVLEHIEARQKWVQMQCNPYGMMQDVFDMMGGNPFFGDADDDDEDWDDEDF